MRTRCTTALGFIALAAVASACEPESPAMPTYAKDVRPILVAHCVRCHGAGGTLQGEPPLGAPGLCHFDIFDNEGDCTANSTTCRNGSLMCAPLFEGILPTMPPLPAMLNAWERDLLTRWGKNPLP